MKYFLNTVLLISIIFFSTTLFSQNENDFKIFISTDTLIKNDTVLLDLMFIINFTNNDSLNCYMPYNGFTNSDKYFQVTHKSDSSIVFEKKPMSDIKYIKRHWTYNILSLNFYGYIPSEDTTFYLCNSLLSKIGVFIIPPKEKVTLKYIFHYKIKLDNSTNLSISYPLITKFYIFNNKSSSSYLKDDVCMLNNLNKYIESGRCNCYITFFTDIKFNTNNYGQTVINYNFKKNKKIILKYVKKRKYFDYLIDFEQSLKYINRWLFFQ